MVTRYNILLSISVLLIFNAFMVISQVGSDTSSLSSVDDLDEFIKNAYYDCLIRCREYSVMYPDDAPFNSCHNRCDEIYL